MPDQTRRRLIGVLGALGAGAALGSVLRIPGVSPTASSTARVAPVVPDTETTTISPVPSTIPDAPAATNATAAPAALAPTDVTVVCRDSWGARAAGGEMEAHTPVRLTLHHTAVPQTSRSQGPARARQHQRHHFAQGWSDLAYHFLVDRTGIVYEGRDVAYRGDTGTEYDPTGHFLVCMEGDFDAQEPSAAQVSSTVRLLAWASREFGIEPASLTGHGDHADTTCPGASVVRIISSMVGAIVLTGPVAIDRRCGVDGAELIEAVEAGHHPSERGG